MVTACRVGLVKMWDAQTGHEILAFKAHTAGVEAVAFTPNGYRLASDAGDKVTIYGATPLPEKP